MPIHRICVVAIVAALLLVQPAAASTDLLVLRDKNSSLVFAVQPYEYDNLGGEASEKAAVVPPITATTPRGIADQFINACRDSLGLVDPATQLQFDRAWTDQLGISHIAYMQVHRGLPVYAGEVTIHLNPSNAVKYVNVKVAADLPDPTPALSAAQAATIALAKGRVDVPDGYPVYSADPELLVLPLGIVKNSATEPTILAWRVPVTDDPEHPIFAMDYLVNAHTGEIAIEFSHFREMHRHVTDCATAPGDANCRVNWQNLTYPSYYHGITEDSALPLPRGPHPDPNMPYYFGSNEVDRLYTYLGAMRDFTYETFGTDGANGHGGTSTDMTELTVGSTHYDTSGHPYCPNRGGINQGSGNIFACRGAVCYDFVGHEYAHAIERFLYSNWPVYWGERGAISESFANLIGQAFEVYSTGEGDWLFGTGNDSGIIFADYRNPGVWGYSCGDCDCTQYGYPPNLCPHPDSYTSPFLYCGGDDNGGVHHNDTVIMHAFYTMAEGFTGDCDVSSIGIDAAVQVYYRALQAHYISMSGSFNEAYYAFILAAQELYPIEVVENVDKGLQAVQLNHVGYCQGGLDQVPDCGQVAMSQFFACKSDSLPRAYFYGGAGDTVWVYGSGGVPGRMVNLSWLSHMPDRPAYAYINTGQVVTTTIKDDGTIFYPIHVFGSDTPYAYDVILDGNLDFIYQPWLDLCTTYYRNMPPVAVDDECGSELVGLRIITSHPNPFNPQTTLSFDIPAESSVTLSVFDLRGSLVRNLVSTTLAPGRHEATWDGRDASGRAMASGSYFARLEAGGRGETVRILLVR